MTVKLPRQVQEAEARSSQLVEDFKKRQEGKGDEPATPPEGSSPKDAQQGKPNDQEQHGKPDSGNTGQDKAKGEGESRKPDQESSPDEGRTDWKAKYLTLQGMYNADVPRLNRELKDAKARMDELSAKLDQRQDAQVQEERETANTAIQEKLTDALGPEVAEAIFKAMDGRMDALKSAVDKSLEPVNQQASEARSTSTQARFELALTERVPDWRKVDTDQRWMDWLSETEPMTGKPRQDLITDAAREGDVDRVATFFQTFKDSHAESAADAEQAKTPVSPEAPKADDAANADPGSSRSLAEQEVPSRTGSSAPGGDKPFFTKAQVSQFYKDVSIGKIPPQKAAEMEAQIVAAGSEGRIR